MSLLTEIPTGFEIRDDDGRLYATTVVPIVAWQHLRVDQLRFEGEPPVRGSVIPDFVTRQIRAEFRRLRAGA